MNIHKWLMGDRWDELPAETVLEHKVSVIIGNTLIALMLVSVGEAFVIAHQRENRQK